MKNLKKSTKLIFLRHADIKKNPNINASLWDLSEYGDKQALKISNNKDMQNIDIIIVSEEKKTNLTAIPLAKKLNKKISTHGYFNEVKRGDKFLTKEQFQIEKEKQLNNLSYHAFNGESGMEALERFELGVNKIMKMNNGKTILIVTHGTILNIYFAKLLNVFNNLSERWNKTDFCSYGIVKEGIVVKDIIK